MQTNKNIHQHLDSWRKPMLFFGIFLAGVGAVILLYLGFLVVQIVNNPADIQIVAVVLEQLKNNEAVISGFLGTEKIDIRLSESLRLALFVVLGALALFILAGVAQTLLRNGIAVMQFAAKKADATESVDSTF